MIARSLTLSALLAFAACGGGNGGTPDARPAPADAASTIDASGNVADAANDTDAATTGDGGNADAATGMDGASGADAAPTPDAIVRDGGAMAGPVINEAVKNHQGANNMEYVEVKGAPSTDLSAYTILQIEGDSDMINNAGEIITTYSVGTTNASGYWWTGYLSAELQNGSLTLLLVRDFTGSVGDDIDGNDDGVIDNAPWSVLADAVAFDNVAGTNIFYAGSAIVPNDAGGASRIPDGVDTDAAADWTSNVFDMSATPAAGEAFNTPGAVNAAN